MPCQSKNISYRRKVQIICVKCHSCVLNFDDMVKFWSAVNKFFPNTNVMGHFCWNYLLCQSCCRKWNSSVKIKVHLTVKGDRVWKFCKKNSATSRLSRVRSVTAEIQLRTPHQPAWSQKQMWWCSRMDLSQDRSHSDLTASSHLFLRSCRLMCSWSQSAWSRLCNCHEIIIFKLLCGNLWPTL